MKCSNKGDDESPRFMRTPAGLALAVAVGAERCAETTPHRWAGPRIVSRRVQSAAGCSAPRLELECRWAVESGRRLTDLATELAALDVDAIEAVGVRAARVAARVTRAIPIVFVIGGDPVAEGLVASVETPGGEVTGLSLLSDAELATRRLALLRATVPGLARLGVLSNPDNALHAAVLVATRRAADSHGIEVRVARVRMAGGADEEVLLEAFRTLTTAAPTP